MYQYDYPRPAYTADLIALCFHQGDLKVLLIKRASEPFKGQWALPGGFVDEGESPQQAAARELREEAGLSLAVSDLFEVGAFGAPGRDPRGWVMSVGILALLPLMRSSGGSEPPRLSAGDDAREARWVPLRSCEGLSLAFDHDQIIHKALMTLRSLTLSSTTALQLLSQPFRHRQARQLYNQIWGEALSPRAFKAWLRRAEALERVGRALYRPKPQLRRPWER